jgi:catechol 2,3-dioxygenase-like lactoylglutathione lyase family enzyme
MTANAATAMASPPALRAGDEHAPTRLSHLAIVTTDAAATTDFYTDVMRMQLVTAVMHEKVPSTGEDMPYLHIFFRMQDGSTIAFFEVPQLPERSAPSHRAYGVFDHLALEVPTVADVDDWKTWLEHKGIDVIGPTDHKIIYSIYFHDPNGIRLEITTPLVPDWNDRPRQARDAVAAWGAAKAHARRTGADEIAALHDLIAAHDRPAMLRRAHHRAL